ncbi:MAG TPA: hypothetical protein DCW60_00440, partial [Sutterella sp.]|nr:hypothetical protein [Sutterella sp.]
AATLREEKLLCASVTVFFHGNPFKDYIPCRVTKSMSLPYPANDLPLIMQSVAWLLRESFVPGASYKKAGVLLSDLVPEDAQSFLLSRKEHQNAVLSATIDALCRRYGDDAVTVASTLASERSGWRMRREFLSPAFTTKISDVLCC